MSPINTKTKVNDATRTTGLRHWMMQVLEECDRVAADFSADPVHDLRVALRRCRSMADGLMAILPDREWKKMKKAGKGLFQRLGDLRDTHVMMEWVEKLHPAQSSGNAANESAGGSQDHEARDTVADALLEVLSRREHDQRIEAQSALEEFDRKQWRQWCKSLPQRAARIRAGSAFFKHLALERWTEARNLHTRALRGRSQTAWHSLRIGVKRFRYIVENFLPEQHKAWSRDLKAIQDLLGEVHDLDVLWNTAALCHVFLDEEAKKRWHARILEEQAKRIGRYREKMTGPHSWWQIWRQGLPQGKQIQALATRRMKLWSKTLDPDFAHSERVTALALELYDGLRAAGFLDSAHDSEERSILWAASLMHDVGKSKRRKGHHKVSFKMIKEHDPPLGWKPDLLKRAAVVARFHRGALPSRSHQALRDLSPGEQKDAVRLAAILRLANALDASHDGRIRRVRVEQDGSGPNRTKKPGCITVTADGYSLRSATARRVAAERYLLETLLRRPVLIKPASGKRIVTRA